jgi:hypothetical protein
MSKAGSVDFSVPGGFCCLNWNPCLCGDKEKLKLFKDSIVYAEDPGISCGSYAWNTFLCLFSCGVHLTITGITESKEGPVQRTLVVTISESVPGYIFSLSKNEAGQTIVNCDIHNKSRSSEADVIHLSNVVEVRIVEASTLLVETYLTKGKHKREIIQHNNIHWALQIINVNSASGLMEHFMSPVLPVKTVQLFNHELVTTPGLMWGTNETIRYTTPIPLTGTPYDNLAISVNEMIRNKAVSATGLKPPEMNHPDVAKFGYVSMTPLFGDSKTKALIFPHNDDMNKSAPYGGGGGGQPLGNAPYGVQMGSMVSALPPQVILCVYIFVI